MEYRTPHLTRRSASPLARVAGSLAVAILALAGCFDLVAAAVPASASTTVVVSTAKNTKVGTVLESGGATLYILEGNKPCDAACLKFWPALNLPKGQSKAKAGKGVQHAKLGSVTRSGGVKQVTYKGMPLFKFIGDHGKGQVNGNITDTWGTWLAVVVAKPKAQNAGAGAAANNNTTTTGGSGGVAF